MSLVFMAEALFITKSWMEIKIKHLNKKLTNKCFEENIMHYFPSYIDKEQ